MLIPLFFTSLYSSALERAMSACTTEASNSARLICYDNIAQKHGLMKITTTSDIKGKGKWQIRTSTDPMTDNKIIELFLESEGMTFGDKPYIALVCKDKKTLMYINWHDYLGSEAYVTSRIGSYKAQRAQWLLSNDKKASFYNGSPIIFIKTMMEQDSAIFQITPYNSNTTTVKFDTRGLKNAIKPLAQTCNWTLLDNTTSKSINNGEECRAKGGTPGWDFKADKFICK